MMVFQKYNQLWKLRKKSIAWNKNLTKDKDERVAKYSKSLKNRKFSLEWKNKLSQSAKIRIKKYGLPRGSFLKGRILSPNVEEKRIKNLNKKPNKKELFLDSILKKHFLGNWKYVGNGEVIFDNFNPDFINCNGEKKIIELYGDFWHNNEKDRNERRIKIYSKYGFDTLVIWEHELKNVEKLIDKIKEFQDMKENHNVMKAD